MPKITEGTMPFHGYQTYYRIAGDLGNGETPILLLHGGPGSTHNYLESLDPLADMDPNHKRAVITYDQLGCGNSYVDGHPELWTLNTWVEELQAIRDHLHLEKVHLLGQSWGGMLILGYLFEKSMDGIASIILSSTLPASWLWGKEQHRLIRFMSEEDQNAIAKAEAENNFESEDYLKANAHFMALHCGDLVPKEDAPEYLKRPKRSGREAYVTAWGPNEYTPNGTLKDFDYIDRLHEIPFPALVISGTNDMSTPLVAKTMADRIPDSKWVLFDGCRHMCYIEEHEKYLQLLHQWLVDHR